MPRRALEPAAEPPATPAKDKKVLTIAAMDAEARRLKHRREMAAAAARWALENNKGSKAACNTGLFGDKTVVTYNMVEPLLRELKTNGKIADDRDHHHQILTNKERRKLATWILACADGQDPKDRTQISTKVREILRARHAANKKKKWRPELGVVRLSDKELECVESSEPRLTKTFFERFYPWCRAHGIGIDEGTPRSQDEKRAVKMTEATVERHFHGEFGLEAELIDAGVMDRETKVIADPRRVLNSDETPQPIDAPQKGSRKKAAKRKGKTVRKATATSKEIATVNMAWDLSGHLYGTQLVLKLKHLHDQLVATAPPGARCFDDATDLSAKQTRTCIFSRSADGMQTQETFLQYLQELDREITAHSNAAVAAGGQPIERPVVLCLDNHASRYSEEVLTAASGIAAPLGIRLFTEEPMTSGFLQSLDQYNAKFHRHYNDARDVYKEAYKARYKQPCKTFGLVEFIKVLGGDAELGVPGMWFSWASPYDIITAWRKVGIAGNVLAPELIDRSEFIDQPSEEAVAAEAAAEAAASPKAPRKRAAELAQTPDGMVSGSLESERAKVARLLAHAQQLEAEAEAPFDPTAAGVLVPTAVTRPDKEGQGPKRKRLSDLHGSVTMRNVGGVAAERRQEDEAEAARKEQKKLAALQKKKEASRAAAERDAAFALCEAQCTCGIIPCPWAGWKRCALCGPKKGLCKAKVCVAARQPLLLGYNPATAGAEGA